MIKKAWEKDKRKVKKLVEGNNFDYFILSLIYDVRHYQCLF